MIDGYQVVSVTPAGRKRYVELLANYLLRERGLIDRHEWWLNTNSPEDIGFLHQLSNQHPDFFQVVTLASTMPPDEDRIRHHGHWCGRISEWFPRTTDPKTIYIRIDDDVVYIAPGAIRSLLEFRIANPNPFLVYPCIINNGIISHLLQRQGAFSLEPGRCDYDTWGIGWKDGLFAEFMHREFLKSVHAGNLAKWQFDEWHLYYYERVSINFISWFGKDFAQFGGQVGWDEEPFLTTEMPARLKRPNVIYGQSIVAHFSYHTQNDHMDKTGLLDAYRAVQKGLQNI